MEERCNFLGHCHASHLSKEEKGPWGGGKWANPVGTRVKTAWHCLDVKPTLTLMRFVCHIPGTKRMMDGKIRRDLGEAWGKRMRMEEKMGNGFCDPIFKYFFPPRIFLKI